MQKLKYINEGNFEKKVCGVAPPAGAGDQRAQAPQIYREKRFFLKKKCAGECTVLKFICMFAVLKIINRRTVTLSEAPLRAFFVPGRVEDTTASNPVRAL